MLHYLKITAAIIFILLAGCASQARSPHGEYIPLSQVATSLSLKIGWNSTTEEVILQNSQHRVVIKPNSDIAMIRGLPIRMAAPAHVTNQEVYILRSFYENQLKPAITEGKTKVISLTGIPSAGTPPVPTPSVAPPVTNKPVTTQVETPNKPSTAAHCSAGLVSVPEQSTVTKEQSHVEVSSLRSSKIIVVDAGHGGRDCGATSIDGQYEKVLNLMIARKLAKCLQKANAKVVMTRGDDTFISLEKRAEIANSRHADAFISIHLNSAHSAARGFEIWVHRQQDKRGKGSLELAQNIHRRMKNLALRDRGIRKGGFKVLCDTNMQAVLIECAFISNQTDAKWIENPENQEILARQICNGIVAYFNGL